VTASNETSHHAEVPALRKGLAVLEALAAGGPLPMSEIQRRAGLNKTMTFRILRTLAEMGYVAHDPVARRYGLGLRWLEFGAAAANQIDIVAVSQPLLTVLWEEFDETVNLGLLAGERVVYAAMLESRQGLRMSARPGQQDLLHSTSLGKAILAFTAPGKRDALLQSAMPFERRTPRTLVELPDVLAELEATRARGYAVDDEENEAGVFCVGAPVLNGEGEAIAGLSISGPATRIDQDQARRFAERLTAACAEISRRMGQPATAPVRV
jgi:IclR family acetate operon transcriptional repressor